MLMIFNRWSRSPRVSRITALLYDATLYTEQGRITSYKLLSQNRLTTKLLIIEMGNGNRTAQLLCAPMLTYFLTRSNLVHCIPAWFTLQVTEWPRRRCDNDVLGFLLLLNTTTELWPRRPRIVSLCGCFQVKFGMCQPMRIYSSTWVRQYSGNMKYNMLTFIWLIP